MWWARKDEENNKTPEKNGSAAMKKATPPSRGFKSKSTPTSSSGSRRRQRTAPVSPPNIEEKAMTLAETISGIEVSLSHDSPSIFHLSEQVAMMKKVYKTQFPVICEIPPVKALDDIRLRPHRVTLFGKAPTPMAFDDMLFLLRSHDVVDEKSCINEELMKITAEIKALEQDKRDLEKREKAYSNNTSPAPSKELPTLQDDWDIHRLLLRPKLPTDQRLMLQNQRGMYLTVSLPKKAREVFSSKCGMKASWLQQLASTLTPTIRPENCRDGGAAATIQHIALMPSLVNEVSFFISRDSGKAYHWGHLPDRLFRRMQQRGLDPHHSASDLVYLSTGSMGTYYAEFRSGECWWGCAADDDEFQELCNSWDVARVVFGCTKQFDEGIFASSWIILSRDGRVAWKNLPARLHRKLESRMANEVAPCEVSLGSSDSYFVRFLDGTTDYCLPAHVSAACRSIEKQGGDITAVYLHPELSHEFIIRSTNLRKDP
jgi:hypothetical protein